jgi:hypothetical protein
MIKSDSPFGFPLCAHLFACERNAGKRNITVFKYPDVYQKDLINHEINMDESHRVKTLLLFLLLHDTDLVIKGELDEPNFNDQNQCHELLENAYSKEMLDVLQPLNFSDLSDIANRLTGSIIIKHPNNLFGFIHQTFKNAVASYFCTKHFDAMKHFPKDVIDCMGR